MANLTQRMIVYKHLCRYGSISSWEAIKEYGITRLSAVIFDLRKNGFDITDRWFSFTNRYGEQSRYKEYLYKKRR